MNVKARHIQRLVETRIHARECLEFLHDVQHCFNSLQILTRVVPLERWVAMLQYDTGHRIMVTELEPMNGLRRLRFVLYVEGKKLWHYGDVHVIATALCGKLPADCPQNLHELREKMRSQGYGNAQSSQIEAHRS